MPPSGPPGRSALDIGAFTGLRPRVPPDPDPQPLGIAESGGLRPGTRSVLRATQIAGARMERDRDAALDEADQQVATLLAQVATGDRQAYETLYRRLYPRVFGFVLRRLRDPSLAEETVVEVFFELWRNAGRFRGESRAATWIFGIAHFKCLAASRAARRSKRSAVVATESEILEQVPDNVNAEDALAARERMVQVKVALGVLPDGQREVIELAFVEGLGYGEIAARLGVAEGTVKTRISRARSMLRHLLEGVDEPEGREDT
jgi:RNA polymerase sigma-70 factor (ECF subfamily)